jgi:uncharacterized protein
MIYTEQIINFECEGSALFGIVAVPETLPKIGVIVIVGGPQYRVGSHRQFLLLSRVLANAGFAALRFDYRGMGDSTCDQRTFESVTSDVKSAIDALQAHLPSIEKFVLWGLCDGASAALLYCHHTSDPRIQGLCLLNPWVRSETSLAQTQVKHYYFQRLKQKEFWAKLLQGKVALNAMTEFSQKLKASRRSRTTSPQVTQSFQTRMALAWHQFSGDILLILSGEDYTAKEFVSYAQTAADWKGYADGPNLQTREVPHVDHTFSSGQSRQIAETISVEWLSGMRSQS